jgi:Na+-transporting methylmalonyl-CoA/oxaloacetate decarboxylase beta subunit
MLTAFVMILIGALIIWWATANRMEFFLMLWLRIGCHLFEIIEVSSDEDTGGNYVFTFTNDEQWQEKMLKELQEMAEKQDRSKGQ